MRYTWLIAMMLWLGHASAQYSFLGEKKLFDITINAIAVSPDGAYLVASANQADVRVFYASDLSPFRSLKGHSEEVYTAVFSPDGKYLATSGLDNQIIIWSTETWEALRKIQPQQEYITALSFNFDGSQLASASEQSLKIFDREQDWSVVQNINVPGCWSVAFSSDGKRFAAGIGKCVRLWNTQNWTKSDILYGHSKPVYSLHFSPDNNSLATGSADSTICVWTFAPRADFVRFVAHDERVQKLVFSNDGKHLISGGSDKVIKVWDVTNWKVEKEHHANSSISDIAFFPGIEYFGVSTTDGKLLGFGEDQPQTIKKQVLEQPIVEPTDVNVIRKERRIALLIGNADYEGDSRLENPVKDVDSLSNVLGALDFEIQKYHNIDLMQMGRALQKFSEELKTAKSKGEFVVALFYFSGHGVQVGKKSFLIPINDSVSGEEDIDFGAFNLNRVYAKIERINSDVNIMVIDACRNNPFEERFSVGARLLFPNTKSGMGTPSEQPSNVLVAYSTSPGQIALDGKGNNSPYVTELIRHIKTKQTVESLFKEVRKGVNFRTKKAQMPWTASTLLVEFSFVK